jgi:hypothetical protein
VKGLQVQVMNRSISRRMIRVSVVASIFVSLLFTAPALLAQITIGGAGFLPNPIQMVSTVPGNGDVNPYGVAFVPVGFPSGVLNAGDILVSNFKQQPESSGHRHDHCSDHATRSTNLVFHRTGGTTGTIDRAGYSQRRPGGCWQLPVNRWHLRHRG